VPKLINDLKVREKNGADTRAFVCLGQNVLSMYKSTGILDLAPGSWLPTPCVASRRVGLSGLWTLDSLSSPGRCSEIGEGRAQGGRCQTIMDDRPPCSALFALIFTFTLIRLASSGLVVRLLLVGRWAAQAASLSFPLTRMPWLQRAAAVRPVKGSE
jgi:hypothetical protein